MEREQIIKGLKCCADENSCEGKCPYYSCVVTVCSTNLSKDALALIKELTEENENLQNIAEKQQSISMERYFEIERLTEENERTITLRMDVVRELTVREFAERLNKHFCHDPAFLGVEQRLIMGIVDQIAKEMLEGDQNDTCTD